MPFLSIALLIYSPLFVARLFFAATGTLPLWWVAVESFAPLLLGPVAAAALIFGVFRSLRGGQVTVSDCLRVGLSRWLPVLWLTILVGLATMVGAILCIIPGVIVSCGLFVAVPALVVERSPALEAMNRSWKLTEGYKLSIFGLMFVLQLIGFAALMLLGLVSGDQLGAVPGTPSLTVSMVTLLVTMFTATISGIAAGVTYHDIRVFREGLDEDELAAVFD
ncbi:MAG: hypothetical protein V3T72_21570 [Thermoanaerobaculia bacterium]